MNVVIRTKNFTVGKNTNEKRCYTQEDYVFKGFTLFKQVGTGQICW